MHAVSGSGLLLSLTFPALSPTRRGLLPKREVDDQKGWLAWGTGGVRGVW